MEWTWCRPFLLATESARRPGAQKEAGKGSDEATAAAQMNSSSSVVAEQASPADASLFAASPRRAHFGSPLFAQQRRLQHQPRHGRHHLLT